MSNRWSKLTWAYTREILKVKLRTNYRKKLLNLDHAFQIHIIVYRNLIFYASVRFLHSDKE